MGILPTFLIIGAPRAGTTWLAKNLGSHPDVYIPKEKELHFFDRHYHKGADYYKEKFSGYRGERAVGEATPAYLHGVYSETNIPALIKEMLPSVRLIVSLRDPVERAYSHYRYLKANHEKYKNLTFDEMLEADKYIIKQGCYAEQLQEYYKYFDKSCVHVLFFEDIKDKPSQVMMDIFDHIGVEDALSSDLFGVKVNSSAGRGNLGRFRTLWMLQRVLLYMKLYKFGEMVRTRNLLETEDMGNEARVNLKGIYKESNERLSLMLGKDITEKWG